MYTFAKFLYQKNKVIEDEFVSGYLQGLSKELDEVHIKELCCRVAELTGRMVNAKVIAEIHLEQRERCLLVWRQEIQEQ